MTQGGTQSDMTKGHRTRTRFRRQPAVVVTALIGALLAFGCESTPEQSEVLAAAGANDFQNIDDLVLVDCLLPGQVRQLGSRMTYLAPRRQVKTTRSDCGIRGGEFVLFDRSDYRNALQSLLPKAQGGDPVAQNYVGEIYEKGLGLAQPDYAKAARWYQKAASNGSRPAQTNLGSLYERGLGVPKSQANALDWYRRATGLQEDRLIFESELKRRQAEFNREIALRNQVAASLRKQLARASQATAASAPTRAPSHTPARGPATQPAAQTQPPAHTQPGLTSKAASTGPSVSLALSMNRGQLESVAESLRRDAASAREQLDKELHAAKAVEAANVQATTGKTATVSGSKAALVGKLELTLRQQSEKLADNQTRLAMVQ